MMIVKFHISQLTEEVNISQRELSRRTGIRQPTINAMANGDAKYISVDAIAKICEVLNCDISDVMTLEKEV